MQDNAAVPVKKPSFWKVAVNIALLVGLIGIFVWQFHKNWEQIVNHPWLMNWTLAGLSFVLLLVHSLLEVLIWNRAMGCFEQPLPLRQAIPIFIWSNLARYIPGKVASIVVRVTLGAQAGRRATSVFAASALELALRIAAALLVFFFTLPAWGVQTQIPHSRMAIAAALIVAVIIGCHPKIMLPLLNWALKKINKEPVPHTLRYRDVLGLFLAEIGRWVVYGVVFVLLAAALDIEHTRMHIIALIGLANASWAAGFIGLTPGGAGIAEGLSALVMRGTLAFRPEVALVVAVLFRFWYLFAEGLWALVGWVLYSQWKSSQPVEAGETPAILG